MASLKVLAASLLLIGSQVAGAESNMPMPAPTPMGPMGAMPYGAAPGAFAPGPYGGAPMGGPMGSPFGGPMAGPYGGGPYGGGPFGGGGPFRGVPFMQSFDMNRPDSFNPMRRQVWGAGPQYWMNPGDPQDGMSQAWDDMMNAPARMGRVPPGWKAPTIDIPNPVDVADEFEKNARRAPYIMRDNFTFN
jgi:hypothetical protein